MQVDQMGRAVPEHINHFYCRTTIKMDNLWECIADMEIRCPDQVIYGPVKYCAHKDSAGFGSKSIWPDSV